MGAELFDKRPDLLGPAADEVLGWSLRSVCLQGPDVELTRTDRAQPALFAVSYAMWEELSKALEKPPVAAAGHSLGEYTALTAAGAFDYWEALRLVAVRGRAMDGAARRAASGMAALLGAAEELAESVCANRRLEGGRLWTANFNAPDQVVVAGSKEDIDWLVTHARDLGIRRVVPLRVAGAFHSPFMAPAAEELVGALDRVDPALPSFDVWANVTAAPYGSHDIRDLLARQLEAPVRFAQSLWGMAGKVDVFVHVGPGDVTAGLARRSVPGSQVLVVNDAATLAGIVEQLRGTSRGAG